MRRSPRGCRRAGSAGGPPPITEPARLRKLVELAGLRVASLDEVSCPFDYPDEDALFAPLLDTGIGRAAMNRAGPAAVRAAVLERLAGNRTPTGGYRLHNLFRVAVAEPGLTGATMLARCRVAGGLRMGAACPQSRTARCWVGASGRGPGAARSGGRDGGAGAGRARVRARCAPTGGLDLVAGVGAGHGAAGDGDDLGGGERKEWSHDSMVGAASSITSNNHFCYPIS